MLCGPKRPQKKSEVASLFDLRQVASLGAECRRCTERAWRLHRQALQGAWAVFHGSDGRRLIRRTAVVRVCPMVWEGWRRRMLPISIDGGEHDGGLIEAAVCPRNPWHPWSGLTVHVNQIVDKGLTGTRRCSMDCATSGRWLESGVEV